jgi:hypothetical protein
MEALVWQVFGTEEGGVYEKGAGVIDISIEYILTIFEH